ncbi:glutamate-cysteine ligase [Heterostelium album PN500]|uniref:Glutamate--cysteine ligase n=1 Tax=Heterostelium pallidum (strain ATCC 26659 / Pp 5 / PN500) TaxID=670386 RepID=D3AY16_HETP5|nr:glutamate-cysteine ligase [Heterostelium album PN500]EFA85843.1 glutamate-cysteine ligase [Heterostelium album PN500]|eukprot:XP_020437949.1 glutamate-cysteine ligase [Heterostelium album PN500]
MGFIAEGNTLVWEDAQKYAEYIRQHGIIQLINIWNANKDRMNDGFKWGDEVEYILLNIDESTKQVKLSLRGHEVLHDLMQKEKMDPNNVDFLWRPEYGRFMIEGTPGQPYQGLGRQLLSIEDSLVKRRQEITANLKPNERIVTLSAYPRMGTLDFTVPDAHPKGVVAESQFLPDQVINPHFRFSTLTANIRKRRGKNVSINIPMFKDINTPAHLDQMTFISPSKGLTDPYNQPYNIYMDAMGFGMGNCCLQTTFQLSNIEEARSVYDHLAVMAPIMLSLTASSAIFKGYLSDIDARWTVISQSVDDRTEEEYGFRPLQNSKYVINKSRYDSIDSFLSRGTTLRPEYNDLPLVYDKDSYNTLIASGMDEILARHFAHLFIRDPLVIYSDKIEIDDQKNSDHFENIQSTNWQTVRFKPPPPSSSIGWRVEFRPMEVQLTDFENAAYIVFVSILLRAISDLKLNFYVPITKVDENMKTAHKRGSVTNEKFYFRKNIINSSPNGPVDSEYEMMTIDEIFNGKKNGEFEGVLSILKRYVSKLNFDFETTTLVNKYISFISKRASGELQTMSTWTREFVQNHKAYKHDSVVSQEIQDDLIQRCIAISEGVVQEPKLLGDFY